MDAKRGVQALFDKWFVFFRRHQHGAACEKTNPSESIDIEEGEEIKESHHK